MVHQLNSAFAKVFETVAPSVVIIEVTKKADPSDTALDDLFFQAPDDPHHRRGQPEPVQSEGSGFIVRPDGFIYTNFHVVEGADKVEVKLKDGREFPGKVVGTDEKTDIAVVKVEANNLPVVQLADSDAVRVGQFAFAIGAPFKLDYTFTYGVISGKGRNKLLETGGYNIADYLQTDTSINPGNSGGPLCDIDGKVVGMNTLINGLNRGLGFAIPSNLVNEIGTQLIAGNKIVRPWLGIRIETLGDDSSIRDLFKGIDKGVVVRTIEADAPAYKSDLRPFDVITEVDGKPVTTDSQLQREILKKKVGQNVELGVWRKGQTMKIAITTGELPNDVGPGRGRARPDARAAGRRHQSLRPPGAGPDEGGREPAEIEDGAGRDRDRRGRGQHRRRPGYPARRRDHGSGWKTGHQRGQLPRCPDEGRSGARHFALPRPQREPHLRRPPSRRLAANRPRLHESGTFARRRAFPFFRRRRNRSGRLGNRELRAGSLA